MTAHAGDLDAMAEEREREIHQVDEEIAALREQVTMLESDGVISVLEKQEENDSVLIQRNSPTLKT